MPDVLILITIYIVGVPVFGFISAIWDDDFDFWAPASLLWPIGFPILTVMILGVVILSVVEFLITLTPKKSKTAEEKVTEYSQAPLKVLVEIVCHKILAHPDGLVWKSGTWKSQDEKIEIKFWEYSQKIQRINYIKVNDKVLKGFEEKPLIEAIQKIRKLQLEKIEADQKAKEQLAALEAIEDLLLSPERPSNESD